MSIIFRKRPDHTVSAPEAKEPHLDLHSIDAGRVDALDDDDIPVLLPAEPGDAVRHTVSTPATDRVAPATVAPSSRMDRTVSDRMVPDRRVSDRTMADRTMADRTVSDRVTPDRTTPILKRETTAVHIPPPSSAPRHTTAHTDPDTSRHTSAHATPQATKHATQERTYDAAQTPARTAPLAPPRFSAATQQTGPEIHSLAAAPELPGHPTAQDYAPFLNTAKNTQDPHNKPELYVWSDDENDAFAQVARRDFTLNRIEPTAGRPSFDASLFRAPSRPDALASAVAPASVANPAAAMQAEIDTLVNELLDESHDYLKRRFLEEIPEIIAKYRQN